jgi:hypothetical protein
MAFQNKSPGAGDAEAFNGLCSRLNNSGLTPFARQFQYLIGCLHISGGRA